ncbi:hypothetical protein [Paraburkholderia sp. UCT31]|uniref:hypothetical protein n=1 Tax=Paraburkholderia sp. UCT31 TaxID=2615209 RepID=UPI001654DD25|nr:hypothetical protein [Paraburkholderia sp. UCT31]
MRLEYIPHNAERISDVIERLEAKLRAYGDIAVVGNDGKPLCIGYDSVRATADGYLVVE